MQWRVAKSLLVLRGQVDELAPNRDKSSDGTIGDEAHQSRGAKSDHNPDANGVVTALDITNDPAHGIDAGAIAEMLRLSKDRRIKYVISNRRICSSQVSPWTWRPYTGINAHTRHVHISVIDDPALYDDSSPWSVDQLAKTSRPSDRCCRFRRARTSWRPCSEDMPIRTQAPMTVTSSTIKNLGWHCLFILRRRARR